MLLGELQCVMLFNVGHTCSATILWTGGGGQHRGGGGERPGGERGGAYLWLLDHRQQGNSKGTSTFNLHSSVIMGCDPEVSSIMGCDPEVSSIMGCDRGQ